MKIVSVEAVPISYRVPKGNNVRLGIGRAVKRDAVLIKVTTEDGVIGWGESHHGRCPGDIAKLVDTTIRELVVGLDARNNVEVWSKVYQMQLATHGMGYASAMALSGLDMALWDIRGKTLDLPLYRLLGGAKSPIRAYAGGISLGWQEPKKLAEEASMHINSGYRALKLRVGDSPVRDVARVAAVRGGSGPPAVSQTGPGAAPALWGPTRSSLPVSTHAIEPPPADIVVRSKAGTARRRRATSPSVTSRGLHPSIKAMSQEVPPISRVTKPVSASVGARYAAACAPAAGPENSV